MKNSKLKQIFDNATWKRDRTTGGFRVYMEDGRLIHVSRGGKFKVDLTYEGTKQRLRKNLREMGPALDKIRTTKKDENMTDPTYNIREIYANITWKAAWIMSECLNDNAPIGWSKYISVAETLQNIGLLEPRSVEKEENL